MSENSGIHKTSFNIRFYLNTRRELVYAVLLAGASLLLIVLVAIPAVQRVMSHWHNLQNQAKKLERLRQQAVAVNDLNLAINPDKLAIIDEVLPEKKPLLEVMAQLGNLSNITGVKIERMELSPGEISISRPAQGQMTNDNGLKSKSEQDNKGVSSLQIKLNVSGTFRQINEFMNLLEKMAPLTTINSFSLSYSGDGSSLEDNQVSMKLTTTTYFYNANLASLPKQLPKLTQADLQLLDTLEQFRVLTGPINVDRTIRVEDLFDVVGWKGLDKKEVMTYLKSQL